MTDRINNLIGWLREHWAGLVLSCLVGMVVVAPPLVWRMSKDYRGVDMLKTNTETLYIANIQEVYDGHPLLGNSYFADGKEAPYLFPPLSAWIIAGVGKLFGFSAVNAALLVRFLAPVALVLLIYNFTLYLTGNKLAALVSGPFVILGYTLMSGGGLFGAIMPTRFEQEKMFIDYGRPMTPQISVLFFYGYLLCFWKFLHEKKRWLGIASALILGTSFYAYFYTWTYLFAFNGLVFLMALARKDWEVAKMTAGVSVGAALMGLPYLTHTLAVSRDPLYAELGPRFGFVTSRVPFISKTMIGATALFALAYRYLPAKVKSFFVPLLLTGFFTVNQHLITGRYFRFDNHHHWYYSKPMVMILLTTVLFVLMEKIKWRTIAAKAAAVLMIAFFFYNGVLVQAVSYKAALPEVKEEQRYAELFQWLNKSTSKDSSVLSSLSISKLLPALTHNNTYHHGGALYTFQPTSRYAHIYLVYTYLKGIDRDKIEAYLESERTDISSFIFGYTYLVQKGICYTCFPDSVIADLAHEYKTLTDENFIDFVKKYPIDYIAWDRRSDPTWNMERFKLPVTATFGDVVVYSVAK